MNSLNAYCTLHILLFPKQVSCERFFFLWQGCMLGPQISHLSPRFFSCKRRSGCPACFGPHGFALACQLSPTTLWILVSHFSPLVSQYTLGTLIWSAWFRTCLPSVSHLSCTTLSISGLSPTCPPLSHYMWMPSALVRMLSHLSPTRLPAVSQYTLDSLPSWFQVCLALSACLPLLSTRMISGLSPTCLHLSPTTHCDDLNALVHTISRLSRACHPCTLYSLPTWLLHFPTCLPLFSACIVSGISPISLHFTLDAVSAFVRTCLALVSQLSPTALRILCPRDFTCLPLHSGFSARVIFLACLPLVS